MNAPTDQKPQARKITVVDLFCGAGGLTRGLLDASINVVAGYDLDDTCKFAYETNNGPAKFIKKSVCDITGQEILEHYPEDDWKVLVGCAPCQPFSTYTSGKTDKNDDRWSLLTEFLRLVKAVQPDVVSMENVFGLERHQVFQDFIAELAELKYDVGVNHVYCPDYGIPQHRKRLVVLASRLGKITLRSPTHQKEQYLTVRDCIGGLPKLAAGDVDANDLMHRSSELTSTNQNRIKASAPGGTWRDWPERLRAKCHKKESGSTYASVYGRMAWENPSPTITTQFYGFGNGRFGHPEQDRALSLREGAMIQTFSKDYQFVNSSDKVSFKNLGRLIGNAVPVQLGQVIGESVQDHLRLYHE